VSTTRRPLPSLAMRTTRSFGAICSPCDGAAPRGRRPPRSPRGAPDGASAPSPTSPKSSGTRPARTRRSNRTGSTSGHRARRPSRSPPIASPRIRRRLGPVSAPAAAPGGGRQPRAGLAGRSLGPASLLPVTSSSPASPSSSWSIIPPGNRDPGRRLGPTDRRARSGDRETMTVFETGPDSPASSPAIIQTVPRFRPPAVGDCRLSVEPGDLIRRSLKSGNQTPVASPDRRAGRSVRHRLRQLRRHPGLAAPGSP
jgi:hypothetical protein